LKLRAKLLKTLLEIFRKLRLIDDRAYFDYWLLLTALEHDLKVKVVRLD